MSNLDRLVFATISTKEDIVDTMNGKGGKWRSSGKSLIE